MPIDKKTGEKESDFISRCISIEIKDGKSQDQAYAICKTKWEEFGATWSGDAPVSVELESYNDYPDGVKSNAKKVLDWVEKNGWGSCGTAVGKVRANQLANGEPISVDTIKRMYSYLSRHEVDLETSTSYSDGCGLLMFDSWGGKAALRWSESKLKELGQIELMNFSKVSFDYDQTLSTEKGMEMAKRAIERGDDVYIISARGDKAGMLSRAQLLGIPTSRVFATGSNKAKVEKIKELGITRHIDNNLDVVKMIPGIGEKFTRVRKVLFDEDFNPETVLEYKKRGFKVCILSKRKIHRKDKKTLNKLKSASLTEDNLVYGKLRDLQEKYNFCDILIGDKIATALKTMGQSITGKQVLKEVEVTDMNSALAAQDMIKDFSLKFVSVKVLYTYELRTDVSGDRIIPTTRDFCREVLAENKAWSLDEIKSLPTDHLVEMGLPPDVFLFRGGFYRVKGSMNTTPFCRHTWKAKAVIV